MAINTGVSIRNTMLAQLVAAMASGFIRFYTGAMPATPETAVTGTLLGTCRFGATAAPAPSGGVITANAITADADAAATGTAGYFRALQSDGVTPLFDGTCSAIGGGGDCQLDNVAIQIHADIVVDSLTYSLPM